MNMRRFIFLLTLSMSSFSAYSDDTWNEIERYCTSLGEASGSAEESAQIVSNCLEEQRSYYQDMPDADMATETPEANEPAYSEEPVVDDYGMASDYGMAAPGSDHEVDCYQQVDEQIQVALDTDPAAEIDYDQMLLHCFET